VLELVSFRRKVAIISRVHSYVVNSWWLSGNNSKTW